MKRFVSFVGKEFRHILRDKRTLLILFGMPIALTLLFGFAITNELRDANIAFLDKSKDESTQLIKNRILSSDFFVQSRDLRSEKEMEQAFKDGRTKVVLVFEPHFARNLNRTGRADVQIIADATDPNTANTLVNYLQSILFSYQGEINAEKSIPLNVQTQTRFYNNPELKGVFYFVPGLIAVLLMLVSAMMTSISIAREKEMGTMEILLASPMKPRQIILAKVVPYLVLGFLDAIIVLILGKFVFGVPVLGSLLLLISVMTLFVLLSLALGILISTVAETQQTALLLSLMALMLPTILLSGFIFPIENMPVVLQVISNVIPARWFIIAVKAIMLKGGGLALIWKEVLILLAFTIFFLGMSIKKFKVRLE